MEKRLLISLLAIAMATGAWSAFASQTGTTSSISAEVKRQDEKEQASQENKDAKDIKGSVQANDDNDDDEGCGTPGCSGCGGGWQHASLIRMLDEKLKTKSDHLIAAQAAQKKAEDATAQLPSDGEFNGDDYLPAIKLYEQLVDESKDLWEKVFALYQLCALYDKVPSQDCNEEARKSLAILSKIYVLLEDKQEKEFQVALLLTMANVQGRLGNFKEKIQLLQKAFDIQTKSRWKALMSLALLYRNGFSDCGKQIVAADLWTAAGLLEKIAEQQDDAVVADKALLALATLFQAQEFEGRDEKRAFEFVHTLCTRTQDPKMRADAACNLAHMYHRGIGVTRDHEKALHWFSVAAKDKNTDYYCRALWGMVMIYRGGDEKLRDGQKVIAYCQEIISFENPNVEGDGPHQSEAALTLGVVYKDGFKDVQPNPQEAMKWLLRVQQYSDKVNQEMAYEAMGDLFVAQKNFDAARACYLTMLEIKSGYVSPCCNMKIQKKLEALNASTQQQAQTTKSEKPQSSCTVQ